MRRHRRPEGQIRQRTPGSFEIRYSLGRDPITGKWKTATATIRGSLADAKAERARLLKERHSGERIETGRVAVGEWLNRWLDMIKPEIAPRTHERYAELVHNYLIPAFGNALLSKLTPSAIQTVYSEWGQQGRRDGKEGGLAPQSIRHLHRVLRASLARACEQQVLARNPADVFKKRLPKVERKEMVTLTAEQSAKLLEALRHSRVYWPVLLALATGMRRGEIMALRWRNVDLVRGIVTVAGSLEETRAGIRFKAPKNEKHRPIPLPAYAVDDLRRHWTEQAQELLRLGVKLSGETLVCAKEDGQPKRPLAVTYEFGRFVKQLTWLPRVRFHDLRHSHATQLLASGVHPKIVQERLGHSSISVTLDLYSHVSPTMQSDAAERLDVAMRGAIAGLKKNVP